MPWPSPRQIARSAKYGASISAIASSEQSKYPEPSFIASRNPTFTLGSILISNPLRTASASSLFSASVTSPTSAAYGAGSSPFMAARMSFASVSGSNVLSMSAVSSFSNSSRTAFLNASTASRLACSAVPFALSFNIFTSLSLLAAIRAACSSASATILAACALASATIRSASARAASTPSFLIAPIRSPICISTLVFSFTVKAHSPILSYFRPNVNTVFAMFCYILCCTHPLLLRTEKDAAKRAKSRDAPADIPSAFFAYSVLFFALSVSVYAPAARPDRPPHAQNKKFLPQQAKTVAFSR